MKTLVVSILAFAASTAAALAGTPAASDTTAVAASVRAELTDGQMDQVKAGQVTFNGVAQQFGFSACVQACGTRGNNANGNTFTPTTSTGG